MEEELIKAVRDWLKLKSVRDIQVFFRFANFYQQFLQGFSRFAAPLTSMLKIISAITPLAEVKDKNLKQSSKEIQVED